MVGALSQTGTFLLSGVPIGCPQYVKVGSGNPQARGDASLMSEYALIRPTYAPLASEGIIQTHEDILCPAWIIIDNYGPP